MWYNLRESGRLDLDDEEKEMFYDTCIQHETAEGDADLIKTWLCANRPVLQQCKHRATKERQRRATLDRQSRARHRGAPVDENDDDATVESVGDEASAGDDASVTSDISDVDLDTQINFFEGLDAQIGSSGATLAPCRRSVPPQRCCAVDA